MTIFSPRIQGLSLGAYLYREKRVSIFIAKTLFLLVACANLARHPYTESSGEREGVFHATYFPD